MKQPLIPLSPNRVWRTYPGGKMLDEWEQKSEPQDTHFPEDWIGSTTRAENIGREELVAEGLAVVSSGGTDESQSDDGERPLADLLATDPHYYFGREHARRYGADPRFLLKFLDSAIRLHIQVHPTVEFSQTHLDANYGKTEGYYILGARPENPDPVIHIGFSERIDSGQLAHWVMDQEIESILSRMHALPVAAGDCFIVPGGLPHAIGADVYMMEVMEPSDFAVRFEFERGGYVLPESARFMDRDVHFALAMTDLAGYSEDEILNRCKVMPRHLRDTGGFSEESIYDTSVTDKFTLRRFVGSGSIDVGLHGYGLAVVTRGECSLSTGDATLNMETHSRCVVADGAGDIRIRSSCDCEVLLYGPPV